MFKVFNGCLKNVKLTSEDEKKINSFIFKRYISNNINGLMFCSYINSYEISNEALYEYFRCILAPRKIQYIPYTKADKKSEDIEFLKKYYPSGDWDIIFKRIPNASKQSIQTKMSKLGIKQINESIWTDEEIKILKQYYEIDINKVQDLLPNRSYKSICTKAQRIGIKNREFWSDEEMEKLLELYPNYPIDDVLKYLKDNEDYTSKSLAHQITVFNSFFNCFLYPPLFIEDTASSPK